MNNDFKFPANTPEWIKEIDFTKLKVQKSALIEVMNTVTTVEQGQQLEGILNLIDALQDYAVDELGVPAIQVFNSEKEDNNELEIPTGIKDGKGTELKTNDKTKCVYICTHCNSDNVQIRAWVKPNEDYKFVDEIDSDELGWCDDCNSSAIIETASLKADAKVIGFQVIGKDNSRRASNIHPDMKDSNCLYNLSQARKMINKGNDWRLLSVWNGDIENPKMMFEGDPRD